MQRVCRRGGKETHKTSLENIIDGHACFGTNAMVVEGIEGLISVPSAFKLCQVIRVFFFQVLSGYLL